MSTEIDKAGQTTKEAQQSKEESINYIAEVDQKPPREVQDDMDDAAEDSLEEEEVELTDEEKAKIDRVIGLVNDRCFVMHHCLEGALGIVMDCVDTVLLDDKRAQNLDIQSFQQYGPMPTDIQKAHLLSTAGMLATKLYESIVPTPKPKNR